MKKASEIIGEAQRATYDVWMLGLIAMLFFTTGFMLGVFGEHEGNLAVQRCTEKYHNETGLNGSCWIVPNRAMFDHCAGYLLPPNITEEEFRYNSVCSYLM